jgi:hypothetical protein
MIVAGTHPPINIDLGSNEPGMTLQREYREGKYLVWRDYQVGGKVVKSPATVRAFLCQAGTVGGCNLKRFAPLMHPE